MKRGTFNNDNPRSSEQESPKETTGHQQKSKAVNSSHTKVKNANAAGMGAMGRSTEDQLGNVNRSADAEGDEVY